MTVLTAFLELADLPGDPRQWLVFLADVSIKGTVVLLAAGAAALVLRGAAAALRHFVWALALGSLIVLPFLSLVLPQWQVPVRSIVAVERDVGAGFLPSAAASPDARPVPVSRAPGISLPTESQPASIAASVTAAPSRARASGTVSTETALRSKLRLPALDGTVWALLIWWTGAWVVICVLGLGLFRVWRTARSGRPVRDREWLSLVNSIARRLEVVRPVTLLETSRSITPMTWGVHRPVILIPSSASMWSWSRRRDVLLHELAHIKRHDYLTQLCARYACALYWFNPLVWLAARELRVEREHACDDQVLSAGAKPSEYAGHLLEIARSLKASSSTVFATVAMARPSQLTGRLLAVLDATRSRRAVTKTTSLVTWLVAVALIVPLACAQPATSATPAPVAAAERTRPAVEMAPATAAQPVVAQPATAESSRNVPRPAGRTQAARCHESPNQRPRSIQSNVNDDRRRTRWQDGVCEGEVDIRGDVRFNDDFTDVEDVARGGSFSIQLYDGDIERRVEIRHRRGEDPERRWFVDGREEDYDGEARVWLADALTVFFRHSSYKADERIDWILSSRGVDGLLQEASQTHGGYLKRIYFEEAIRSGELSTAEIDQLIAQAADEISSDFELAQLLMAVPPDALRNDALRGTYVAAAAEIDSDFEKRRVLSEILKQEGLSETVVASLLRTAATMDSDFELAQLLTQIGDRYLGDDRLRAMYLQAAGEIDSDFERRRVLSALLEMEDLSHDVLLQLLQTAADIDSDFELRQVLVGAAHRYVIDDALRVAFFDAVSTVDSDFEHRNVLQAVMDQGRPTPLVQQAVLESAVQIDSDFELATLLMEIAGSYLANDSMRSAFFRAVETLDSDFERRRVLVGLIEDEPEDRAVVLGAVAAARDIDSDFEKGQVLVQIAQRYRDDETVRAAVMDAADTISSDHEYGRVMSAVRGRR